MKRIVDLVKSAWEFIAGDDWLTALGVVVALGITALLADRAASWLVMPGAVAGLLAVSIWRAAARSKP